MKNTSIRKFQTLGFIGGGRITKIFLQGFKNKNASFGSIMVFDTNVDVTTGLQKLYPHIHISKTAEEASNQEVVFVAIHPPVIMEMLVKISSHIKKDAIVISLAPKISIEKIKSVIPTGEIVRMIPNATSYINEGYNPVCFSGDFAKEEKTSVLETLGLLGNTFEVPESKLEAYAIVSAMLPTYFWFQWKEMMEIGEQIGLSIEESVETVHNSLQAALDLMFKEGLSYDEVVDLIPVKPIGDDETNIREIYQAKLMDLFNKIKP
jgi:pyrroline-5-carboxylate reductase